MKNKLILVDGSSVLSKHYYGTLPFAYKKARSKEEKERALQQVMKTRDGQYTNAVYGMVKFLLKVLKEQQPTHMVVAWDVSRNTFRKKLYTEYKGQRGETPNPLKSQFSLAQHVLRQCGFYQGILEGMEADDIIGTFAKQFETKIPTYIITGDQDALQLITEHTRVWLSTPKAKDYYGKRNMNRKDVHVPDGCFEFTTHTFQEEYGLAPLQIIDQKALEGDSSDNIPGVMGVGPKSVLPLLQEFGTVEGIYDAVESYSEEELKVFLKKELGISRPPIAPLVNGKESALLSKQLATIKTDIAEFSGLPLEHVRIQFDRENAKSIFQKLEFNSLVGKI